MNTLNLTDSVVAGFAPPLTEDQEHDLLILIADATAKASQSDGAFHSAATAARLLNADRIHWKEAAARAGVPVWFVSAEHLPEAAICNPGDKAPKGVASLVCRDGKYFIAQRVKRGDAGDETEWLFPDAEPLGRWYFGAHSDMDVLPTDRWQPLPMVPAAE